jgi:hypothetical protein
MTKPTIVIADHIGGSARGYQELFAPLASPATAEQADGPAVFLCIGSAGRERPLLPQGARLAGISCRGLTIGVALG